MSMENIIESDDGRDTSIDPEAYARIEESMRSVDWSKYARGSEAFFGIEHDLEKLSKVSKESARELWEQFAPKDAPTPPYLDPEHKPSEQAKDAGEPARDSKTSAEREGDDVYKLPSSIVKKFIAAEQKFYFRDGDNKLAFEDRGRKMVTEHNHPDVAMSMVEIAEAKGWGKIKVAGHDDFRREVWLQASLKGIEVAGYKPKDVDLAKLAELREHRMTNRVERGDERVRDEPQHSQPLSAQKSANQQERSDKGSSEKKPVDLEKGMNGELLEHGAQPFNFDKKQEQSYFVKLQTEAGQRIYWGKDLERAMQESGVKPGSRVELENLGRKAVTVEEKQFDKDGKLTGVTSKDTHRNEWRVDPEGTKARDEQLLDQISARRAANLVPGSARMSTKRSAEWAKADIEALADIKTSAGKEAAIKSIGEVAEQHAGYRAELVENHPEVARQAIKQPAKEVQAERAVTSLAKPGPEKAITLSKPDPAPSPAPRDPKQQEKQLGGDFKVVEAVMSKVLKENGLNRTQIQAAMKEARSQLAAMQEKGTPAPKVRAYDSKAARETPRVIERTPTKEAERTR